MQQEGHSVSPRSQLHREPLRRMGSNPSLSSTRSSKETHNLFPSLGNMLETSVSQITEAFKNLTSFVSLLDNRIQDVEKENAVLRQQITQSTSVQSQQQSEINDLREKLNNLAQQLEQAKKAGVSIPTQPVATANVSSSAPAPPPATTPPSPTPTSIHSASSSITVPPPPAATAKKLKVYVKHDLTLNQVKTPTKKAPKTIANLFGKYKPHSSQQAASSTRTNLTDLELIEKALDFAVAEMEKQASAPIDVEIIDTKQYKQPVRSAVVIFVVRLKDNQEIEDWNGQVLDEVQEFFAQNNKIVVLTLRRIPCPHPELVGNSNAQLEYNGVTWKQVIPGSHHAKARTLNFFTLGIDDTVNDFIPGEQNGQEIKKLSALLEQAP